MAIPCIRAHRQHALAGGVAEQRAILPIVDGYMVRAGTEKTKLQRTTIWLSDIRAVDDMNKVWEPFGAGWFALGAFHRNVGG